MLIGSLALPAESTAQDVVDRVDAVDLLREAYELTLVADDDLWPQRDWRFQQIAVLLAAAGATDVAWEIVEAFGDENSNQRPLLQIAYAQARKGDTSAARSTQIRLRASLTRSSCGGSYDYEDVDREIGLTQARNGRFEAALQTARSIRDKRFAVPVFGKVALEQQKRGLPAADEVIQEAIRAAKSIPDPYVRVEAWLDTARIHQTLAGDVAARDILEALLLVTDGWTDAGLRVYVWREVAAELCILGERERAVGVFRLATDEVARIQGRYANSNRLAALKGIASVQARVGLFDLAHETVRQMKVGHDVFDVADKEEALRDIALARIAAGDSSGASRTARRISEFTQYRDDSFSSVAIEIAESGDVTEAVESSNGIENDSRRAETLLRIATRSAQDGDPVSARAIAGNTSFLTSEWDPLVSAPLRFDFDRPETWGRIYEPCFTGASCSAAFERARDLASAAVSLQVALRNTDWSAFKRAFSDVSPDVLYGVACAHAETGDEVGAVSWARQLESPAQSGWALVGIADGILEKRGRHVERGWR